MHFIWIIDGSLFPFMKGNGGVSSSYILPQSQSNNRATDMAGGIVWMLLRIENKDVLFSRIQITQVEQFEDGYNKGDYLLSVDPVRSFRVISNLEKTDKYLTGHATTLPLGISLIELSVSEAIEKDVLGGISINFRKPSDSALDRIPVASGQGSSEAVARRFVAAVSSSLSLEDIWATRTPIPLPPFAYFSYLKAEKTYGQDIASGLIDKLILLDPTASEQSQIERSVSKSRRESLLRPFVDVALVPIDVTKLYARRFIAREASPIDLNDMAKKTEHAEKIHQDMLRDIASYLQSLNIVPMQSSSIDLSIEIEGTTSIFELKSSNPSNLFSQSAKGAFQLLCYKSALIEDGKDVRYISLILQHTGDEDLNLYMRKILESANVRGLYYDSNKNWPERVEGLMEGIGLHQ